MAVIANILKKKGSVIVVNNGYKKTTFSCLLLSICFSSSGESLALNTTSVSSKADTLSTYLLDAVSSELDNGITKNDPEKGVLFAEDSAVKMQLLHDKIVKKN